MPALLLYAGMFTATLLAGPWSRVATQRRAWWSLVAMTTLAASVAVWFIFLQAAVLGAFCLYCMAAHTCSLVLFGLVVYGGPQQWPRLPSGISAEQLLGLSKAARSAKLARAEVSLAGAWKGYRRWLLTGVAAAIAMIASAHPTPEPIPKTTDSPKLYPRSSIKSDAPKIEQLTAIRGRKIPSET